MSDSERTVCINVDKDGVGVVIWDDDSVDPDLDELIEYLVEECEITDAGTYVLVALDDMVMKGFGLYTVTEPDMLIERGILQRRTPKLTTWPPRC